MGSPIGFSKINDEIDSLNVQIDAVNPSLFFKYNTGDDVNSLLKDVVMYHDLKLMLRKQEN